VRRLAERLRARGFLTTPLVPPAVPEGAARLRLAVTAGHHAEEVARFIPALLACTGGARDRAAG
jgi:7-keto-8-aminopelargonate synthetase-like enzyme